MEPNQFFNCLDGEEEKKLPKSFKEALKRFGGSLSSAMSGAAKVASSYLVGYKLLFGLTGAMTLAGAV